MIMNKIKQRKAINAVYKTFSSDEMRAVTILMLTDSKLLSTKGQSLGSMGIADLVKQGIELPFEPEPKPYVCPVRDNPCPYHYDACTDPTKFCRIIEDTPEHYTAILKEKKK